jgi:hypothetical protein
MCHTFSYWITPDSLFLLAVLPSITGDTVLFYPIWKVTYEDNSFSITGIPICARFDSAKITFLKPKMIFEISDENNESAFKNIGQKFKELIIKSHYLNSDNTVDPTYWFRFITDDDFFFADYKTNEKKAEILKKSKKDYFNYMLDNYYRNKAGSDFNNPIPKSDYSGWEEEYHPHWKDSIGKKRQLKTGN